MQFKINHFNINVVDLQKSIEFYKKNLMINVYREKIDPKGNYHIVYLTDDDKKVFIELTWIKSKVGKYNLGDNEIHLAFETDDFDNAYKMHKENGVIIYENPEMGIYFIGDPDGYWVEIIRKKER